MSCEFEFGGQASQGKILVQKEAFVFHQSAKVTFDAFALSGAQSWRPRLPFGPRSNLTEQGGLTHKQDKV